MVTQAGLTDTVGQANGAGATARVAEARAPLIEAASGLDAGGTGRGCPDRRRYQHLQDLMEDVYLVTDGAGVIHEANPTISGLFGNARTYILGKPVSAFVDSEDRSSLLQQLRKVVQRDRRPVQWEGRLRPRRQGETIFVRARIGALAKNNEGDVARFQWLLRDVSAERGARERLRALEHELERRVQSRTAELEATVGVLRARLGC